MSAARFLHVDDASGRRFITLDGEGHITGYCGHVDLGTGIETALAQIVAEELDRPVAAVTMVLGDTARTPDQGPTIASETIQVSAIPLRQAAATLRAALISRAALRLNTAAQAVGIDGHHASDGETRIALTDLLNEGQDVLTLDEAAPFKARSGYTIVGRPQQRVDLEAKLRGEHVYIHDVVVAGMLHGHVIRPPYAGRDSGDFIGRSLISYDDRAIAGMDGFVAVVREQDFLAVVATQSDLAQRLAEALPVQWHMPPPLPNMETLSDTIRNQPSTKRVLDVAGNVDGALAHADKRLDRTYVWPYHLHGSIGPSCAVADWADGAPIVWSGTQNPHMLRDDLALLCDLPGEAIEVRRHQAAGCYGRNCADDVAGDALLLSRAVGRPVRVQLTRAQESLWEPKGAAQIMDVSGALKEGALHAYTLDTWYPSNRGPNLALLLTGTISPEPRPIEMGDRTAVPPYAIANKRISVHDLAPIVRAAWMRGVSALPNTFAHECFIDELAYEAGEDPVAFRLAHLDDERQADLVRKTAEAAGWTVGAAPRRRREGRMAYGQGFAFATYVHGTFPGVAAASAAWVCDVQVDLKSGEITLTRVFVGQDQGLVINPDGVRQQIHGNVHQTAGRALLETVTFDEITPTQRSWSDYPIMRFPDAPQVETMLVERPDDPPLGVGESAAVPSASAIANAIFDATGVRLREAPFTPERMRQALREAGYQTGLPDPKPWGAWRPRLRKVATAAGLAVAGALTFGAVSLPVHRALPPVTPSTGHAPELIEQGRLLFLSGNCGDCHTAEGGVPNAGGKPVETPFGIIYTTNLTPDPQTGLGNWSFTAFERAMRHGISRDGSNLYPAFPYTSFAGMSEQDLMALYAYLQSLEAVVQPTPQAQMIGPAALRPANAFWNALYHRPQTVEPDPSQDAAWNRGRYLVETVGHCSACHTPRSALGAERRGTDHLAGALINGWYAPALIGEAAGQRGWNAQTLDAYLRTGHVDGVASAGGPMAEVVGNLAQLPASDTAAMATYLASLIPAVAPDAAVTPAAMPSTPVHRVFEASCATCHEPSLANMATAARNGLSLSSAVRAPTAQTVETVIRDGLRAPAGTQLRDMPGFASDLSPRQIADLARYVRARYAPDLPPWRGN